jgi:hypothetical protein
MSGLLGMALHGLDAGTEYRKKKSTRDNCTGTGILGKMPVIPEANKSITREKAEGEKAEGVKSNETHSSRSSVSPRSSMKSHNSQSSELSKSATAGSEAQRELPLGSVPEDAAAAAAVAAHSSQLLPQPQKTSL